MTVQVGDIVEKGTSGMFIPVGHRGTVSSVGPVGHGFQVVWEGRTDPWNYSLTSLGRSVMVVEGTDVCEWAEHFELSE